MSVRVLFFSQLRDVCGTDEIDFDLEIGTGTASEKEQSVGDLLSTLYQRFDGLAKWDARILVAVNQEYAERGQVLKPGDEIAVMPPVQGG